MGRGTPSALQICLLDSGLPRDGISPLLLQNSKPCFRGLLESCRSYLSAPSSSKKPRGPPCARVGSILRGLLEVGSIPGPLLQNYSGSPLHSLFEFMPSRLLLRFCSGCRNEVSVLPFDGAPPPLEVQEKRSFWRLRRHCLPHSTRTFFKISAAPPPFS